MKTPLSTPSKWRPPPISDIVAELPGAGETLSSDLNDDFADELAPKVDLSAYGQQFRSFEHDAVMDFVEAEFDLALI